MAVDVRPYINKIIAATLPVLSDELMMTKLINSSLSGEAARFTDEITIPVTMDAAPQDVVPSAVAPATDDVQVTDVKLRLDQWKYASFRLNDADLAKVDAGLIPPQITERVKGLAAQVNMSILQEMAKASFNTVGVAGQTPFAYPAANSPSALEAIAARRLLDDWRCEQANRRIVLNGLAEANALSLPIFQQYLMSGDANVVGRATIGTKLDFDWYKEQRMPSAPASGLNVNTLATVGVTGAGATSAIFNAAVLTGTLAVGSTFTVNNDPQNSYVVTAVSTAAGNQVAVQFYPGVNVVAGGKAPATATGWAAGTAVNFRPAHALNFAFHSGAVAFATRASADMQVAGANENVGSLADPKTGLTLRMEVVREHYQTNWKMDLLYGVKAVRPEHIIRIMG
jgi:hypothetical protein